MNPLKHIDPVMSLVVPFLLWRFGAPVFGAARPVPVNPLKYRNFRRGDIIVSLAGIATNFGLFVVLAVCFAGALYGLGSMWYAKKKQNFGGVNEGQATLGWALGAAAGTTVLRGLFTFFGI